MGLSVMVVGCGIDGTDPQREAIRHRVETAVAKRIAANQPPSGEQGATNSAEAPD